MKLANEQEISFRTSRPPSLSAVLRRLELLSLRSEFALQRELAFKRALKPYLEGGTGRIIAPLKEEVELASSMLFCDFYPEDGQLTLIEQLRDVITEHIPHEERVWLDLLKHSYLDLLEVTISPNVGDTLVLRSLGDGTSFFVPYVECAQRLVSGQVLLTRIVLDPDAPKSRRGYVIGCGIILSAKDGRAVYAAARNWERSLEISSGSFELGVWQEFVKRFGHILLWSFAEIRLAAVVDAVAHIQYRNTQGRPYLYAIALYDHAESWLFAEGFSGMTELELGERPSLPKDSSPVGVWILREVRDKIGDIVAKLTLTSSQLIVECDGPDRLNTIKHRLASAFGFSLHFRAESVAPPARTLSIAELASNEPLTVLVTEEEDRAFLNQFLEKAYLEWSDQPHHLLKGQTPRHAVANLVTQGLVEALIAEMEHHDLGIGRIGRPAFDYNKLRAHVGLDEVVQ